MRSWVIGRGVSMFCIESAMAWASGPPMKIGSTRRWPAVSRRITTGVRVGRSGASTLTSSISTAIARNPTPRPRIFDARSGGADGGLRGLDVVAERLVQQHAPHLLADPDELGHGLAGPLPGLGVALLEQGQHDLLEQPRLAIDRHLVGAHVARLDAVL